jgi:hypothetical protein
MTDVYLINHLIRSWLLHQVKLLYLNCIVSTIVVLKPLKRKEKTLKLSSYKSTSTFTDVPAKQNASAIGTIQTTRAHQSQRR